jgi:hypothetical protein
VERVGGDDHVGQHRGCRFPVVTINVPHYQQAHDERLLSGDSNEDRQSVRSDRTEGIHALSLATARHHGAGVGRFRRRQQFGHRTIGGSGNIDNDNARNLRSGDPDLMYPGETIVLPPID